MAKVNEKFVKEGADGITQKDVKRAAKNTGKAKHKANRTVLKQLVDKIHDFADMLNDYAEKRYREVPLWVIGAIAFVILYIVNPWDIVPDAIPILGLLDDLAVATIVLAMTDQDIKQWKAWRKEYDRTHGKEEQKKTADKETD